MKIPASELDVMRDAVGMPGLGAAEVHAALADEPRLDHADGQNPARAAGRKGRADNTAPKAGDFCILRLIAEKGFKADAAGQFVDRLFEGRASALVAHLADTRGLSEEDLAELEKLIGDLKK